MDLPPASHPWVDWIPPCSARRSPVRVERLNALLFVLLITHSPALPSLPRFRVVVFVFRYGRRLVNYQDSVVVRLTSYCIEFLAWLRTVVLFEGTAAG